MLLITCPWCGERDQTEFHCHGEAFIARPANALDMTDEEWGDYVFFRKNVKGIHYERWSHDHGCGRWFIAVRNTATDEFLGFYKPGEEIPAFELEGA
ncbi:MAG: sarcosine oxidase subunit delta [Pseudomonadota bacterium]